MADSVPQTPGGEEGANAWEKPWSIEEMRKSANDWSLAGDAGMLHYLQNFSQRIISRTHDMQEQMNGLLHESKLAEVRVQNAFNDFIMLANTQFVENRVYDEDISAGVEDTSDKKEEKDKTREEREAELIPKITTAMQLGLSVIDTAFDKLDVNDVNSDSEEDDGSPYKTEEILEPKDPYIARPLPYLIGSQAFMTDDDVGLRDVHSEDEESDAGVISESESETESEPEIEKKPPRKQSVLESDESESESESDSELFDGKNSDEESDESDVSEEPEQKPTIQPTDFAAELAAKMDGAPPPQPEKKEKKLHESKRDRSSSKSKHKHEPEPVQDDDLFGPPPMEDEDSPFGTKGGLFSTGGGLFDEDNENEGGLFDDIVVEKPKPVKEQKAKQPPPKSDTDTETESEDEEAQPKVPPSRARTRSGKPIPQGGVSIFAGGDDELFGSKREDSDSDKTKSKPKDTKKPATTSSSAIGLFDDDEEDLFAAPVKKEHPPKQQPSKPAKSLFDEDEEEDLFATSAPPPKKEIKEETPKPKKKLPVGAVSMFGNNSNPLAAAIKAQRQPSEDEESDDEWDEDDKASQTSSKSGNIKPAPPAVTYLSADKKDRSPSVSSNSLFAEEPEDDLFASKAKAAPPAKNLSQPKPRVAGSSKGLFGDEEEEDDLFAASNKPKPTKSDTKQNPKATSLFYDEEEDDGNLFGAPKPANLAEPSSKKKPPGGVPLFDDDLFGEVKVKPEEKDVSKPKEAEKPARPRKNTLSLFDEDQEQDQEIFNSSENKHKAQVKPPQTLETKNPTSKPRTRSLFADDDVLFGGAEEDPAVDLFGASSPLSPSEESKAFPPQTEITKEPASKPATLKDKVEVKGATISASSTDLFATEEDGDLFSSPLGTTHSKDKVDPKVEVKGATTSESSTDKSAKPQDIAKRKPVGGVSMFGGMDPTAMLKKRSGPKDIEAPKVDEGQHGPDNSLTGGLDSTDLNPPAKSQNDLPPKKTSVPKPGGPPRSTSIGKLQANLGINPSALLPGAVPRVKDVEPAAIGFDAPVQPTTLHTVQKDRVRVQNKRRPPTRKPRISTSPSGSDFTDSTEVDPAHSPVTNGPIETHPVSQAKPVDSRLPGTAAPTSSASSTSSSSAQKGMFDEGDEDDLDFTSKSRAEPTVSGVKAPMRTKPETQDGLFPDTNSSTVNVPKAMSDIFSEAFSKSSASKKTKSSDVLADDQFASTLPPPKKPQEKKVIVDITDDLFGDTMQTNNSSSSKVKSSKGTHSGLGEEENDIFSSAPKQASSSRHIQHAPSRSPPPLDASPDDIFSDSSLLSKKASSPILPEDDDDIFASSSLKTSKPQISETDDIFATSTTRSSKTTNKEAVTEENDDIFTTKPPSRLKKKTKAATKDEALFEDNTDIFSDLPAPKAKEKKTKKTPSANDKSLFRDDIDDIFADSGVKSKPKKAGSKKTTSKAETQGDSKEGDNIFDDPLNALTH